MSFPHRIIPIVAVVLMVGGCSLQPFVDEPLTGTDKLVQAKHRQEGNIYVCYNSSYTTPKEVAEVAREECARTGKVPRLLGQTFWQCRLFIPTRAHYVCVPPEPSQ